MGTQGGMQGKEEVCVCMGREEEGKQVEEGVCGGSVGEGEGEGVVEEGTLQLSYNEHPHASLWQQAAPACNSAHEIMFPTDTLHLSVLLLQSLYKALHRVSLRRMQRASPTGISMLLLQESPTGTCQQVY